MDGFDRIYDLHRILKGRKTAIPLADIMEKMECSRATFNRVKRHMTDFLGAPIEYSRDRGGYFYNQTRDYGYELPGLWLKEEELHALLLMQAMIKNLGAGILANELYPIEQRVQKLLAKNAINPGRLQERFRVLGLATREVQSDVFLKVSNALLHKQTLHIEYQSIESGTPSVRDISPQRLIHYRHNWYVDCWCHKRENLRTFALDAITSCKSSDYTFKNIFTTEIDKHVLGSYGLTSAENIDYACIHFYLPQAARVTRECWHPQQKGRMLDNNTYELTIPFNAKNSEELIMDILRMGPHAKIVSPPSLQEQTKASLSATIENYK